MSDFSVSSPDYSGLSLTTHGSSFSTYSGSFDSGLGSHGLSDSSSYGLSDSNLYGLDLFDSGSSSSGLDLFDISSSSSGSDANIVGDEFNPHDYNSIGDEIYPTLPDSGLLDENEGWTETDRLRLGNFIDSANLSTFDNRYGEFIIGGDIFIDDSFSLDSYTMIAGYKNDPFGIGFGGQFDNHGFHSVSGSATYNDFSFTGTHNLDTYSTNINAGYNFTDNFSVSGSVNHFVDRFRDPSILFRWRF